jgi:hypothetical protein
MGRGLVAGAPRGDDHRRSDAGGVWIVTGWVVGLILWAGVLVAWHAGFGAAAPFVVIPAILVFMIGAGNLIGGRSSRPAPRFNRPDPMPIAALRPDPGAAGEGAGDGTTTGEPGTGP